MKTLPVMKSLIKTLLIISMVLCVSGAAIAAHSFASEIDPKEFYSWTIVEKHQVGPGEGTVIMENPNPNAKIKKVTLYIQYAGLLWYSYDIDGKTYKYEWNYETRNYDSVEPEIESAE